MASVRKIRKGRIDPRSEKAIAPHAATYYTKDGDSEVDHARGRDAAHGLVSMHSEENTPKKSGAWSRFASHFTPAGVTGLVTLGMMGPAVVDGASPGPIFGMSTPLIVAPQVRGGGGGGGVDPSEVIAAGGGVIATVGIMFAWVAYQVHREERRRRRRESARVDKDLEKKLREEKRTLDTIS